LPPAPINNNFHRAHLSAGETAARRRLTLATLEGMQEAFNKGGQKAINKVMRESPAIFLKMLVLLVPREMDIQHSGSIKAMTDDQIEQAILAVKALMEKRMIDVTPNTTSSMEDPKSDPD
jgi:hypothetical protein